MLVESWAKAEAVAVVSHMVVLGIPVTPDIDSTSMAHGPASNIDDIALSTLDLLLAVLQWLWTTDSSALSMAALQVLVHEAGSGGDERLLQSHDMVLVLDGSDMDVMEYMGPDCILCDDVVAGADVLLGLTAVFSPSADAAGVELVLTRPLAFHTKISHFQMSVPRDTYIMLDEIVRHL